jgi:hypothetical protein
MDLTFAPTEQRRKPMKITPIDPPAPKAPEPSQADEIILALAGTPGQWFELEDVYLCSLEHIAEYPRRVRGLDRFEIQHHETGKIAPITHVNLTYYTGSQPDSVVRKVRMRFADAATVMAEIAIAISEPATGAEACTASRPVGPRIEMLQKM